MTNPAMRSWIEEHEGVFSELQEGLLAATGSAGDAARVIDSGADEQAVGAALDRVVQLTDQFLDIIQRARALPLIPNHRTAQHFGLGLARWREAAEAQRHAARHGDGAEMMRAGAAYEAGTAEFYRAAAALREATGQEPDRRNPYS